LNNSSTWYQLIIFCNQYKVNDIILRKDIQRIGMALTTMDIYIYVLILQPMATKQSFVKQGVSYASLFKGTHIASEPQKTVPQVHHMDAPKRPSLMEFVMEEFPDAYNVGLITFLLAENKKSEIKTWREFAEKVSYFVSRDEPNMRVTKSSTWAVCQVYLGRIHDREDWEYAMSRGGLWSPSTSVRSVLNSLFEKYP